MADILAIVSKAIFETSAYVDGRLARPGDVWPTQRYVSTHRAFNALREGGRIMLVTVRPPDEELWFVGSIDEPLFDGTAWVAREPNSRPVTNITALRQTIMFTSGKGLSQTDGALAMSLQTPRALTEASAREILLVVGGAKPRVATDPSLLPGETATRTDETETEQAKAQRVALDAAIASDVDRFVVLFDKMQESFGLRLPESLAYAMGFLHGLSSEERAELESYTGALIGVGAWFEDELAVRRPPNGDERLRDRDLSDPPELIPLLASAKERWGLWYDDSDELPTGIAVRWNAPSFVDGERKDVPETYQFQTSLLLAFRERIVGVGVGLPNHAALVNAVETALRKEAAKVRERSTVKLQHHGSLVRARMNPYLPDQHLPLDLVGDAAAAIRQKQYEREDDAVNENIERALAELRDGAPGRALFIGRELHAMQIPKWRFACTELLIRAYAALGRQPLGDIVRASYLHADPAQPIFELPPPHPVAAAAFSGDVDEILTALKRQQATSDDLEEAIVRADSEEAMDALLDHVDAATHNTDTALWRRLQFVFRSRKPKEAQRQRALAIRLMERGSVSARAFERILRSEDKELVTLAAARVGLDSTYAGQLPLHIAARAPDPPSVKKLLERGADSKAKNADGRMAYDAAREAQAENPADPRPSEILQMLQVAGGGMAKPSLPASTEIEYAEGDEVTHRKLGDGVVQSVSGEGEEAKLVIKFETETRTFLAKFVTPKAAPT